MKEERRSIDPVAARVRDIAGRPSDETPDDVLVSMVAARDQDAFQILWERFGAAVFSLCLRRLADRQAAEDATQEAFINIWRRAETFDPERGSVAGWLYAVARNAAGQVARHRPVDTTLIVLPRGEATEDDDALTRIAVHGALARLAPAERQVLELAYFEDLSQSQIAAHLRLPLGTVKTRTRSGLQRMARYLEDGSQ